MINATGTIDRDMQEFLMSQCVQDEIITHEDADRAEEFSGIEEWRDSIIDDDDIHADIVSLVQTMELDSCVAFLEIIQPRLNELIRNFGTDSIDVEFAREIVRRVRNRVVFPDQKFATAALINSAKKSTNRTWELIDEDGARLMGKRTTQPQPRKYRPIMSGRSIEELREEWRRIERERVAHVQARHEIMDRI